MKPRAALSLLETVFSVFFLLAGVLVCLGMVRQASRGATQARQMVVASELAERTLESIREWAYDPDHYFSDWAIYRDAQLSFDEAPQFSVHTLCPARTAWLSPNSTLELPLGPQGRRMEQAYVPVKITVSWGGARSLSLQAQVGKPLQPVRAANPVRVVRMGGAADPVPFTARVQWSAGLYSTDDQEIPGVGFRWQVLPHQAPGLEPGNAWFEPERSSLGARGQLIHRFYAGDPQLNFPPHKVPGWVRVRAEAIYGGRTYRGESVPLRLAP